MDPITVGSVNLTKVQEDILDECLNKKRGGLSLPMGSGKTLLSIMTALHTSPNEPILTIVSKSLINNWIIEIKKFFGESLKYGIIHPDYLKIEKWGLDKTVRLYITTPQTLSKYYKLYNINHQFEFVYRPNAFVPAIKYYRQPNKPYSSNTIGGGLFYSTKWGCLIVDEAQGYTNINSNICKSIASLCCEYRWLLSGTMFDEPKPERIFGYYILLNWEGAPRCLPDFMTLFYNGNYKGVKQTLIHRTENANFTNKPKLNKQIISHTLSKEEEALYLMMKGVLNELREELNKYMKLHDTENTKKFSSYLLAMISYLRQGIVCPIIPIATVAIDMADYNCKSQLSQILMNKIKELGLKEWFANPDSIKSERIKKALEIIDSHKDDKLVIFSCFRTSLKALQLYLPSDRNIYMMDGNMSINKRGKELEEFSKNEGGILLLTYELGCNGLNLQCANTVLLLDYWWNAGKTNQAIARVMRYGQQSKKVNVYYFTSNTGLEKCIYEKQYSKLLITEELFNGNAKTKIPVLKLKDILSIIDTVDNISLLNNTCKY